MGSWASLSAPKFTSDCPSEGASAGTSRDGTNGQVCGLEMSEPNVTVYKPRVAHPEHPDPQLIGMTRRKHEPRRISAPGVRVNH